MLYKCPSCGQTLLEFSGKFASPNAKPIRRRADANDRQQGSELPAQQKSEETIIKGAGKSQELSSINILPSQRQSELASSDSTTSDPVSCQWRIAAARGERIRLKFTHMGMVSPASDPSHCIEEYVEVRDGYHAGSPLIVPLFACSSY
ncbi:Bone morphoproteintic protein 1 [Sparganum proliferum]